MVEKNVFEGLFSDAYGLKRKGFDPEEMIFRQGDPALFLYAVEEGRVRLERSTIEGKPVVIHAAQAGDSFAEAALFSDVYHCNAVATLPSRVIFYPKGEVLSLLRQNPQKTENFMAVLAGQVRALRTRLELRSILSARERILQYFFLLASSENHEIEIPHSLKNLASELGLAHETLYRELAKLEKDKIIARTGSRIKILQS